MKQTVERPEGVGHILPACCDAFDESSHGWNVLTDFPPTWKACIPQKGSISLEMQ